MIFSKERITLAVGMLMFVIGVMPSLYIFDLSWKTVMAQLNEEFATPHSVILNINEAILDPITCPSILVAGDTIQVSAEANIPEDLLSEYRIYMRGYSLSDTPGGSIVFEEVTDRRKLNQAGEGKSQFLWRVTISQPGIYRYAVVARNKGDEQNQYYTATPRWDNSDREECLVPVISSIGFTGNQLITINKFWIAIFLIAGLGICVWWFNTYPSNRGILMIQLLTFLSFLGGYIIFGFGSYMPFGKFALLAMVIPLLSVFLAILLEYLYSIAFGVPDDYEGSKRCWRS